MAFQKGGIDEHQKKGAFTLTARSFLWLSYKKQDGTIVKLEPGIAEAFAEFAKKEDDVKILADKVSSILTMNDYCVNILKQKTYKSRKEEGR